MKKGMLSSGTTAHCFCTLLTTKALPAGKTLPGWPSKPAAQQLICLFHACTPAFPRLASHQPAIWQVAQAASSPVAGPAGTCTIAESKVSRSHVVFKAADGVLAANRTEATASEARCTAQRLNRRPVVPP